MSNYYNRQWRLPNNENKDKQSNYSMDFDAANSQVVNIDHNSVFNLGTSFTISGWFNFSSNKYQGLISFDNTSPRGWFLFQLADNSIKLFDGTSAFTLKTSYTTTNQWDSFIVTYDGTDLVFYVNGTQESTQAVSVNLQTNGNDGQIGNNKFSTGRYFNGKIDGVSIFNYALSSSQVTTLYGSSSTGIGNPMSLPKPVAYYPLGDQDAFNGANYLVPNSSLKDFVFNFDSDYIDCGNTIGNGFSSITVSSWVNFDNPTANLREEIVSKDASGGRTFALFKNSYGNWSVYGTVGLLVNDGTTTNNATASQSDFSPVANTWYHVLGTWDGTNIKLYINGDLKKTTSFSATSLSTNTSNVLIGDSGWSGSYNMDGQLSNVQIFNTALAGTGSNSVETLYNYGSPLTSMSGFSSLVSWWKLDASDTYDSSTGNWTIEDHAGSNDGTSSGMTQANLVQSDLSFTSGYSPYALEFDAASSDYIDTNNAIISGFSSFTASAWVNFSTSLNLPPIFYQEGSASEIIILLRYHHSLQKFQLYSETTNGLSIAQQPNNSFTPVVGQWYNILALYDGSNLKIYLDTVEIATITQTGTLVTGTDTFKIGKYSNNYFNGSISNCSIWNTALTSAQVTELYNEGVPSNLNNHSAYSNLVSWWQLGSNSSYNTNWTVLDEKGTNNGTSSNMGEDAIVDGVGSYANGLSSGMGGDEVIGDAPYSSANSLSVNMDIEDRVSNTPS
tara:strand:- start:403 stop:2586 length:2184 start_codon:yes stop_codon:yes gene_type:complete